MSGSGTAQAEADAVTIRACHTLDEFDACVALEREVWNFADLDLIPAPVFVVAAKIGGQVIGAFAGQQLIGFVLAIPGIRNGHAYLHSHMLAVRAGHRDSGTGRLLKLAQRRDALDKGIELIEWTFDPLETKNAHFNIARLGAIARRYNINQYGNLSSALQGGLPSDRLVAEWWLQSRRVETLLGSGTLPPVRPEVTLAVPGDIDLWKRSPADRSRAERLQTENREIFLKAFAAGLVVLGYEREGDGGGKYLLGRWEEGWSYASR